MMAKPYQPKILVAMPAYNEARYIGSVILKARQYADEVIVLDYNLHWLPAREEAELLVRRETL